MLDFVALIPLFPALGALTNGLLGKQFPKPLVTIVTLIGAGGAFALSAAAWWRLIGLPPEARSFDIPLYLWLSSGGTSASVGFLYDTLTSVMLLVVTGVGFLVHVYATAYMEHDKAYWRFFCYLNLFVTAMLILVLGNSFLLLFVGWEGVGLCSYLLISFWYTETANANAGKKAFITNRVGDFGFILGILLILGAYGSIQYADVFKNAQMGSGVATWICLCLLTGAMGKSAQLPLHVWLPDAMAGPTPVSALIHAATMVTAGVYMVVRCNAIFALAPVAQNTVTAVGIITSLFAASVALKQNDIKKILAWSTVSQLGYMFVAAGLAAYTAAIFHLVTHAFFKALLFLGAGSVIHGMSGEQDITRMGGLKKKMPVTFWTMSIGALAIAGFPLMSGFCSKDEILWMAYSSPRGGVLLYALGLCTAAMTAFYMARLIFTTFFGDVPKGAHPHESPAPMTVPLMILAVLSVFGGAINFPPIFGGSTILHHYLHPVTHEAAAAGDHHATELMLMGLATAIAATSVFVAWKRFKGGLQIPGAFAESIGRLFENKYYVDEIYDLLFVRGLMRGFGKFLWEKADVAIVDGSVNGAGALAKWCGAQVVKLQTGYIQNYATAIVAGLIVLIAVMAW